MSIYNRITPIIEESRIAISNKTQLTMNQNDLPVFMAPPGGEVVSGHQEWIELLRQDSKPYLPVRLSDLESGNVEPAYQHLMALQHHPDLFAKAMFSLDFRIFDENNDPWEGFPAALLIYIKYQSWLVRFGQIFKPGVFFLADLPTRILALTADLLKPEQREAVYLKGVLTAEFRGKEAEKLAYRILLASMGIDMFFWGSGISARPYIEAFLTELNANLTYEQVQAHLSENLKANVCLQQRK